MRKDTDKQITKAITLMSALHDSYSVSRFHASFPVWTGILPVAYGNLILGNLRGLAFSEQNTSCKHAYSFSNLLYA